MNGTYPLSQSSFKHGHYVMALDAGNVKALGPALQDTLVNVVLSGRV